MKVLVTGATGFVEELTGHRAVEFEVAAERALRERHTRSGSAA
jgi:uncharacterized protein YbjT (DUF2867 family)